MVHEDKMKYNKDKNYMSSIQDLHTMQQEGYKIPELPLPYDLETKEVLKQVNRAISSPFMLIKLRICNTTPGTC